MRRYRWRGVLCALFALLAGCSTQPRVVPTPSPTASSSTPSASASVVGAAVTVSEAANGTTVQLRVGQLLQVVLHSTYWTFDPPTPPEVVREVAAPSVEAGQCLPGIGCGTATVVYAATDPGEVILRATRRVCGEALACRPGQGAFTVTVAVRP